MTGDTLDDLLYQSMPATREIDEIAFAAMIAEARREAAPTRRSLPRIAIGIGLAALLVGGAGVAATAGGLFSWSGWAADPDIGYAFTLPSGRHCEERIEVIADPSAGDGLHTPSAAGEALKAWARSADFDALVDVEAELAALDPADGVPFAEKQEGIVLPNPDGPDALMIVLAPEGGLDVVPKTPAGPTADDLYANAVDRGLWTVLSARAAEAQGWATGTEMQCEPVR